MSDQIQKQSAEETASHLTSEQGEQNQKSGSVPTPELKVEIVENRANPVIVC